MKSTSETCNACEHYSSCIQAGRCIKGLPTRKAFKNGRLPPDERKPVTDFPYCNGNMVTPMARYPDDEPDFEED